LLLCGAQPRALAFGSSGALGTLGTLGTQEDSISAAGAGRRGWRHWLSSLDLTLPSRSVLLAQVMASIADVAAAGLTLYVILPHGSVGFASFLAVYSAALLLGMIGHTPAGLGVFEAAMMFAIGTDVPMSELIVALLAYRTIYFLLPLVLSAGLVAAFEGGLLKARLASLSANRSLRRLSLLTPMLLSGIIFVAGAMLVFSGAVPAYKQRLELLSGVLPLWVLEGSQLLSSVTGVLLLFIARGLMRRLDAAWWLATGIVAINLALSMSKGLAFFETGILTIVLALLLSTRSQFHRSASLFAQRFTVGWLLSVAMVIGLAAWLLFFAFRSVPYRSDLWWDFAFDERASRALRTTLVTAFLAALIAVWQLLRPAPGRFVSPAAGDLLEACCIVQAQERSDAGLAMMGDKSFLFSGSRRAFLMYAKRGRTWAALHDPVGPREEWAGLIRDFVTLAHSHGGRAAFYQVRADALPLYLDAGLTLIKLGEEAQLSLDTFSLVGPTRANLRYALKRGERDGLTLEVVTPERVAQFLPTLRRISNAWLDSRSAKEKSFSVAAFTTEYLAAQSVGLIYQNGVAVAFATFMTTNVNVEATIGVMRHVPEASAYTMEYLFTSLALYLKQAGFAQLSLGMSPLSGLMPSPLASVWHRLATFTWRFGGRFYNFKGLRAFKEKFQPCWEPRYLAASGSFGMLFTLADLSLLADGWRS
jgi:phosphatidylglycerol lysyltransferase